MATVSYQLPITPYALQAVVGDTAINYNATDQRLWQGASFPRIGRLGLGDSFMVYPNQAGANWSIDVQAGEFIAGSATSNAYAPERYLVTLAARTNVPLTGFNTAPVATRTHNVYLTMDDKNVSGTVYGARIVITEDIGSGAPAPDATMYATLASFTIASGQSNIATANITNFTARTSRAINRIALTYASGFSVPSGAQGMTYSLDGNTVRMQGAVQRTSTTMVAGSTYTIGTLPIGYRPSVIRGAIAIGDGPGFARVLIDVTGTVTLTPYGANPTAMSIAYLDAVTFELN